MRTKSRQNLAPPSIKGLRVSGLSVSSLPQGSWDLVTAFNMDYNPTYSSGNPIRPFRGAISRVVRPVISSH